MQAKFNPLENGTWPRLEFVQNPTFRALTHGLGYSGRVIGSLRLAVLLMEPGPLALAEIINPRTDGCAHLAEAVDPCDGSDRSAK
jgi:hypothetical protein